MYKEKKSEENRKENHKENNEEDGYWTKPDVSSQSTDHAMYSVAQVKLNVQAAAKTEAVHGLEPYSETSDISFTMNRLIYGDMDKGSSSSAADEPANQGSSSDASNMPVTNGGTDGEDDKDVLKAVKSM